MNKRVVVRICTSFILAFAIHATVFAETVGVFFDSTVEQIKFAAGDVKTALESKGFSVEVLPLSSLASTFNNKKVVIALTSDKTVTGVLTNQGGTNPSNLGEQAYSLQTTASPEKSFWVLGGDANGAMYGGLQIAENIQFDGFAGNYDSQEAPTVLKRGIKLNLPWDRNSQTYWNSMSKGSINAIPNVWDSTFWKTWFDEMARNRYNVFSFWSNHPFTSLIKLPGYEDCAIQNVMGRNKADTQDSLLKKMTIDEKIVFWKQIMAYAHSRGFEFLLFNWNIFTYGATGKHSITEGESGATNPSTITYMYKSMVQLLETYPDLDGFGVTMGEGGGTEDFLWKTYGKGMYDYAVAHPERKLRYIQRLWLTDFDKLQTLFAPLKALPNVKYDVSRKYCFAHMYSAPVPTWTTDGDFKEATDAGCKTWLTVRNDDYYYHNWGDPDFARAFVNGMTSRGDTSLGGFYMGSDGWNPTRTFFSKNSVTQGTLEVQRQWYMFMLWGRLSYNPLTSDNVFKNYMKLKYQAVSSENLFTAWSKASGGLPKVTELIQGTFKNDQAWWPEACKEQDGDLFLTATEFGTASVAPGSSLCSIGSSATGGCDTKKTSYMLADEIETDAMSALTLVNDMSAEANTELGVTINNIKAMSYLTIYYANKIRGATYLNANQKENAKTSLSTAYCWWMKYSKLMDAMYYGMATMQRQSGLPNWHSQDAAVLKEYSDLGGTGSPICGDISYKVTLSANDDAKGTVAGAGTYNPSDEVIVKAVPKAGYRFVRWMENNVMVSSDISYKFTIESDKQLVAYFVESNACAFPWNDAGVTVNKTTVNKTFGPIDISCAPDGVTISANLEGVATDNSDYCRIFYKVDGGTEKPIAQFNGPFSVKTVAVSGVKGNNLEIIVKCATSWADEFYYITNIKVDIITSSNSVSWVDDIEIYPNPASTILNIKIPNNKINREIKVYNSVGQLVYSIQTIKSNIKLNVKSLNLTGLVTVQVIDRKNVSNHKILLK